MTAETKTKIKRALRTALVGIVLALTFKGISGDTGVWRVTTASGGSTLTGMKAQEPGAVRVLTNYGPGALTLTNRSSSSDDYNQYALPGAASLTMSVNCTVVLRYEADNHLWFTIASSCVGQ